MPLVKIHWRGYSSFLYLGKRISWEKQTYLFLSGFKIEYRHKYTIKTDIMHEKNIKEIVIISCIIIEIEWKVVKSIMCVMMLISSFKYKKWIWRQHLRISNFLCNIIWTTFRWYLVRVWKLTLIRFNIVLCFILYVAPDLFVNFCMYSVQKFLNCFS